VIHPEVAMTGTNVFCDELERRRLFSADVVNGMLVVVGTNGPDRITIWQDVGPSGPVIQVVADALLMGRPPETYQFPADGISMVVVRALAGDDAVNLFPAPGAAAAAVPGAGPAIASVAGAISIPSRIDAGLGNDSVTGGNATDTILGGFGNDTISGGTGNDFILGGWGNDTLWGNAGNDFVSGNNGDDTVYGNEGDDHLYGGAGNDRVGLNGVGPQASEPGNDFLVGGPGEDRMVGGEGKDRIYGGTGRDHFSLQDDDSEMLDRTPDEPKDIPIFV
jgi:Ca2+-binding RTX toxin-like protein